MTWVANSCHLYVIALAFGLALILLVVGVVEKRTR